LTGEKSARQQSEIEAQTKTRHLEAEIAALKTRQTELQNDLACEKGAHKKLLLHFNAVKEIMNKEHG